MPPTSHQGKAEALKLVVQELHNSIPFQMDRREGRLWTCNVLKLRSQRWAQR